MAPLQQGEVEKDPLITSFLPNRGGYPLEARSADLASIAIDNSLLLYIWQFERLAPGQSIRQRVQHELAQNGCCAGPSVEVRGRD